MNVGMEPLVRSCDVCRDLVDKAKDFLLLPERRSSMAGKYDTALVVMTLALQALTCGQGDGCMEERHWWL